MKVLFIGGTGIISSGSAALAVERGIDLTLLNRGQSQRTPAAGAKILNADIRDLAGFRKVLDGQKFDVVVDFLAYTPDHVQTDLDLFAGHVDQYMFISSASAYQTPAVNLPLRESTPLDNPVWEYSRNKIACEELLQRAYRESKLPFTIVRPSHTYDPNYVPLPGGYTTVDRMLHGKPVIVPGDGTSIWTLTHTRDFATGLVGLLGNARAIGEVFHITSDEWLTWDAIYLALGRAFGVEPKLMHVPSDLIAAYDKTLGDSLRGDKMHSAIFDNSKVKQVVPDFRTPTSFSQGAREIAAWFMADPVRQKTDPAFDALTERILAGYAKSWPI
ncbi:MAG TPA: SDR family oxidoreductase [Bellilinea sp.]|nr:SDR family oxidoreductase [Bellilinea sp.]